jgi:hypothetical protein
MKMKTKIKKRTISVLLFVLYVISGTCYAFCEDDCLKKEATENITDIPTVLIPSAGEKAYKIAGEVFADMWAKVTGKRPVVFQMEADNSALPEGDVVIIGSDAVNFAVHDFIRSGVIDGLNLQYGSDNYHILSVKAKGQNCLILAGGNGRSAIYAVYDFFRKQAGAEYFWDGDIIPHHDRILLTGIDILEQPRFEYRGLRYFAHRGLHRYQAEHWDLEDWKKEIDWLMKKRFNLFMLRTGVDDLFQRAFPGDVPYPPVDEQDPDAEPRSYDDRTSFWPLRYRGELRKKVLQYARDRGLIHPEDIGTITHWYSHTPGSFYRNKPGFPVVTNQKSGYSLPTQAIWDIESQEAWDAYWNLTRTHLREFSGDFPCMFHTIGMAERVFGKSDRENLQSKLYVYRKTQQQLREHFPNTPLLIGSWDFIGWNWTNEGVQRLIKEFDPARTILFDYTADKGDKVTYREWDVYNQFPWIFGIFHSLVKNSDIHENYSILAPRLKEAAVDPKCIGLITWPEISHSDTYLLEYLADNSWQPDKLEVEKATSHFCKKRYPQEIEGEMEQIWNEFLNVSQTLHWGLNGILFGEPQFRVLTSNSFVDLTPKHISKMDESLKQIRNGLMHTPAVLKRLAILADRNYDNPLWRRDVLDITRTIVSRAIFASLAQGTIQIASQEDVKVKDFDKLSELSQDLMAVLSDILAMSDDFSMDASLLQLQNAEQLEGIPATLNPHSELTLKGNSENNYCRSQQYELVQYVYRPELHVYWEWALSWIKSGDKSAWKRPAEFNEKEKTIVDKFYSTPLAEMAPAMIRNSGKLSDLLTYTDKLINELLKEIDD